MAGTAPIDKRSNAPDPLSRDRLPEVREWVAELKALWIDTGQSINGFVGNPQRPRNPITKGAVSKYLSGKRIPESTWFLKRLLVLAEDNGIPRTPHEQNRLEHLWFSARAAVHPVERARSLSLQLKITDAWVRATQDRARALELHQLTTEEAEARRIGK